MTNNIKYSHRHYRDSQKMNTFRHIQIHLVLHQKTFSTHKCYQVLQNTIIHYDKQNQISPLMLQRLPKATYIPHIFHQVKHQYTHHHRSSQAHFAPCSSVSFASSSVSDSSFRPAASLQTAALLVIPSASPAQFSFVLSARLSALCPPDYFQYPSQQSHQ